MKNKYKILLVEPDEVYLLTLKEQFEQVGYTVESAQNSAEALEKLRSSKYHIVLTEIDMPNQDGIELLREIKQYDAFTQVIMMTGNSTMSKILSSFEYGANDYLVKPFTSYESVISIIDYSVQKLERWRESIVKVVS